jgi:hypothetical protein
MLRFTNADEIPHIMPGQPHRIYMIYRRSDFALNLASAITTRGQAQQVAEQASADNRGRTARRSLKIWCRSLEVEAPLIRSTERTWRKKGLGGSAVGMSWGETRGTKENDIGESVSQGTRNATRPISRSRANRPWLLLL